MDHEASTGSVSERNLSIYTLLWSFIFGILVSSLVSISPVFSCLLIALSGAIFVIEKLRTKRLSHEVVLIIIALSCFGLGSFRYAIKDFHEPLMPSGEGMVDSEPEHRDTDTRFVYLSDNGEKVLVSTDMYSHVEYGDRVRVGCNFKEPGVIVEDSGREFDYKSFLSKDDIYYTCSFAKVSVGQEAELASGANVPTLTVSRKMQVLLTSTLLKVKSSFIEKMKAILPEPQSSLLAGLIVAGKEALPKSVLQDFQNVGVVHIVVLSGYNITIVAEFFLVLLGFFSISLRKRALFAALGILVFVLMAGASASIIRAALMALALLLGKVVHRQASAPRMLLVAAALMLLENPKLLVYDPSFQLTFLAMLALIYVEPLVKVKLGKMPDWLAMLLATTIATQITVLPFLLYSVGSVSLVSLISNILILVFVPFTMLVGFVATLLAFISTTLAWPLAFVSHILLAWILGVAHTLGNLPFSSIKISHFSVWLTLTAYAVYLVAGKYLYSRMKPPA